MDAELKPLTSEEVAVTLANGPFAGALAEERAVIVGAGLPPRARFANAAALGLMEATGLDELDAALFSAESPGARRLRRLAETMPLGGAPRLERLRFYRDGAPIALGLVGARARGSNDEPWLVLAAPIATGETPKASCPPAADVEIEHAEAQPFEAETIEPKAVETEPAPPPAPFVAPPLDGPVRFLWALDAEGRFGAGDPALTHRLGPNAPAEGEPLTGLIARVGLSSAWAEAVAAKSTFSAVRVEWIEPGGERARVVRISGAPVFDRARAFQGFRGFGVFTGDGVAFAPSGPQAPLVAESPLVPAVASVAEKGAELSSGAPATPRHGAAIVVLRPQIAPPAANVVPIRPGALGILSAFADDSETPRDDGAVELSTYERDAFREIARALGVRTRALREELEGAKTPPHAEAASSDEAAAPHSHGPRDDLAGLIDALPIGALVVRGGETLFANRPLLEFAGFATLEALQDAGGAKQMFRGRDPEVFIRDSEDALVVGADGDVVMVQAHARRVDWRGAPATLIALRRAREAEHQAETRGLMAESHAHAARARAFLSALDAADDGFVRLDATGRLLAMSPRAEALFGYDQKETAGESFLMLLAPVSHGAATAALQAAMRREDEARRPVPVLATARDRGGRLFPARLTFGRWDEANAGEGYFVVQDREAEFFAEREREAARDEAEQASARKTEFLAAVSHEIRTPLHAILGFAEVMIEERFGPIGNERYKDYVRDIHASGRHVMSLADDLLDLAKVESGRMELNFAPVDANQVIRDCIALMQPQAARERIIMRMSLSERLPNVMADARSLRQIMLNLMSNAVKYNEPGGQVIVSTALDEEGHAVIRVRDTGVGMSDSELSVALQPFMRAGAKDREGTGLGLPLTKALVEANHADFSIKSHKDQGTLVEVAFPSVRAAQ